jgi:membrane protein
VSRISRGWVEGVREFLPHLLRFVRRVLTRFYRKKGLLLASALAFNALLSMVPLLGLTLVIISHFADTSVLMEMIHQQLDASVPQSAPRLSPAITQFIEARALASGVGIGVTIFFSALAFRTLDDALSAIFESTRPHKRRHPVTSFVLPLVFMGVVIMGMVILSLLVSSVDLLPHKAFNFLGIGLSLAGAALSFIQLMSFVALVALFASFYRIMPEAEVTLRQGAIGGAVAAVLWEVMRRLLTWYFANVSLVGLIYGSLTTVIILLLTFEIGAIIVLLGGQVIAELVRSKKAGIPWYEEPDWSTHAPDVLVR